jgi:hypothetical protein
MLELRQTFEPDLATYWATYLAEADVPVGGVTSAAPGAVQPESIDLELPGWIWGAMAACYGLFFGGLLAATGRDAEALFAIVVSLAYTAMYFGTATLLFGLNPARQPAAFARRLAPLQTWTGPMETGAVAAQVLTVPACLALFGLAVAVIRVVIVG